MLTFRLIRFSGHRSDRFVIDGCSRSTRYRSSGGAQFGVVRKQRPGNARIFVGDRDQRSVIAAALLQRQHPARDPIATAFGTVEHRARPLHKQASEIGIAALADMAYARLAAGRMPDGHKPEPSGKLPSDSELPAVAYGGDNRKRGGRANAADLH